MTTEDGLKPKETNAVNNFHQSRHDATVTVSMGFMFIHEFYNCFENAIVVFIIVKRFIREYGNDATNQASARAVPKQPILGFFKYKLLFIAYLICSIEI